MLPLTDCGHTWCALKNPQDKRRADAWDGWSLGPWMAWEQGSLLSMPDYDVGTKPAFPALGHDVSAAFLSWLAQPPSIWANARRGISRSLPSGRGFSAALHLKIWMGPRRRGRVQPYLSPSARTHFLSCGRLSGPLIQAALCRLGVFA